MALDPLRAFLRRHRRIALDTSVFIYQLEANARYLALTDHIFTWIERPGGKAVTSTITMTELLVQPYRVGNEQQADEFFVLLSTYPNIEWMAANLEIADRAAKLRALHRLRTPDALQSATAIHAGATGFVTNDPVFERVKDFETLLLDKLL
ncbi:MAG: type II toxin-antitoxin system VapC family toxin [Terriglobales bacterium]